MYRLRRQRSLASVAGPPCRLGLLRTVLVLVEIFTWLVALAIGLRLQRGGDAQRLNRRLWRVYFATIAPAVVAYTYTTVTPSRALLGSLVIVACASWLVLGVSFAVARLLGRTRGEVGALTLAGGWGNTSALGYPFAQLVFGTHGLALQVLYAQFCYGVPGIAISASVARLFGETASGAPRRRRLRVLVASPPLIAAAVAITLRLGGVDATSIVRPIGVAAGLVSGPFGFLQLGVALPLGRFTHDASDLARAASALAVRHVAAPLVVAVLANASGVRMPAVFLLAAAAPVAFHVVTLGQVYHLRPDLLRLVVVASTVGATIAVVVLAAFR